MPSGISPTSATMSGFGTSSIWRSPPSRLILRLLAALGAKSATAAAMTSMSAPGAARITASRMAAAVVASTTVTPRGAVTLIAPAIEGHAGAAIASRLGDRDPHLAAAAVADEADRVDRLAGSAGADHDLQPVELAGADEETLDGLHDRLPARRGARRRSARWPAPRPRARRSGSPNPRSVSTLRCVAGWVHMPASMAGATTTGARLAQRDGGDRIADVAGRQLGEQVGGRRRDHDRVRRLGQLDVGDLRVGVQGHHVADHRAMGERPRR